MFVVVKGLVQVQVVHSGIDDTTCNVGAVVTDTFHACKNIVQNEACFNAASAALKSSDMACTHLFLQVINNLLKRLNLESSIHVFVYKCLVCKFDNVLDSL